MMQIVVDYLNGQTRWYQVPEAGWRIDAGQRFLIVGAGVPRIFVPLDTVASFTIESSSDD